MVLDNTFSMEFKTINMLSSENNLTIRENIKIGLKEVKLVYVSLG